MSGAHLPDRADRPTLAVVGATGAVGTVLRQVLSTRQDIWGEIRLIASSRSAGRTLSVRGEEVEVSVLTPDVFNGVDVAVFDVPDDVAATWVPVAAERGAVVVDGSSVFRMDEDVPLVVPEVNARALTTRPRGIVANPDATTLSVIVALGVLHAEFGLEEFSVATYQAASGAGRSGVETLYDQVSTVAGNRQLGTTPGDVRRTIGSDTGPFPAALALNVLPWAGGLGADGWSTDELRIRDESRKILQRPQLKVAATCVQVPVISVHSAVVHAVFENEVSAAGAAELVRDAPSLILYDDPTRYEWPTPADVVGTDPIWVGRVRRSLDEPRALDLFICADNLRKGAALNGVQIAELIAAELTSTST